jgi:hypothetical protein
VLNQYTFLSGGQSKKSSKTQSRNSADHCLLLSFKLKRFLL